MNCKTLIGAAALCALLPLHAKAQTAPDRTAPALSALKGLAPVSVLMNSDAGKAALGAGNPDDRIRRQHAQGYRREQSDGLGNRRRRIGMADVKHGDDVQPGIEKCVRQPAGEIKIEAAR